MDVKQAFEVWWQQQNININPFEVNNFYWAFKNGFIAGKNGNDKSRKETLRQYVEPGNLCKK